MKKGGNREAESPDSSRKSLRQRAEEIVREREGCPSEDIEATTPGAMRQELHELLVHQIELEIQNDELRRAQVELEDARARYLDLYDMAPVGYCTISEKGLMLEINLTAAGLLGVARSSLINMPLSKFIYKEDQDIYYLRRRQIFETGEPQAYDLRMKKIDGTVFWAHLDAISLQASDGMPVCRVALSDITERKKVDEALRESEEKLRVILENSREGINMLNLTTGKYEYMNLAQVEMTGFTQEEMNDFSLEEVFARIHPEDRQILIEQQKQIASGNDTLYEIEYRWKVKSGEYRWFNDRRKLIKDLRGRPLASIGISRDITDKKQAEESMSALVEQLRQADRNKNDFISILSHELRNPLASISAGIQVLDLTQDKNQAAKVKEIINRQTNQLCKLVDDLLDLARITQNKIKLKKENINLNEIVKSAVGDIRFEYEKKGIKLGTKIQTRPVLLNADPVRITQTIGNILKNALKFTQENGTVWLTLKTEKNNAVITVKDNGIGISPEILLHLFTPFTQADNTLDRRSGGLGLGLSIVKGIVGIHGGSVSAHSDGLGKGSIFTIRLPITTGNNLMVDNPISGNTDKKSLKLLVIEDNRDFADLLSTMLFTIGYDVNIAYDGIEGVKLAKQIEPDVIFCDIGLPGMNGYDIADIIRNDKELEDTQLIALTGYAGEGDVERATIAGFNKHLAKPIDLATLKMCIKELKGI